MRLDKFLCDVQLGTRSQVKDCIKKGDVSVNGCIIKNPDYKLDENADSVSIWAKGLPIKAFIIICFISR